MVPPAAPGDDRPDTRHRILDVADRLFRHYGYDKTTVADIARELSMSSANVYRFFGSKLEIVEAIARAMFAERHRINLEILASEGAPSERLHRLLVENHRQSVLTLTCDRKVHDMVEIAMAQQWPAIEAHLAQFADVIEELIHQGVAAGEFAVADTRRAAVCARQSFVSMIHPTLIVHCSDDRERAGPEELADFVVGALRRR
ncbi:MAG: TetR/AcrR family transcriptional regulator [Siculibacillus sp.]